MSTFSDQMAAVGLELLTEFGEAVTFSRTATGDYSPSTATLTTGAVTTWTGYGAPVDYDTRDINGVNIEQGDVKLFVNAVTTVPMRGDALILDSITYRIMSVRKYAISSENVLYELQLRI